MDAWNTTMDEYRELAHIPATTKMAKILGVKLNQ